LSTPGDGGGENGDRYAQPDDDWRPPPQFQQTPTLWQSISAARMQGATKDERNALAASTYTGFVDRSVDPATRAAARQDALEGFRFFGAPFDWNQWRREMGY
jgi:hypothetical protein